MDSKAAELLRIRKKVLDLKRLAVQAFKFFCANGLYTLKFHPLNHLMDNFGRFGGLKMLDASLFEPYNVLVSTFIPTHRNMYLQVWLRRWRL